MLTKRLKSSNTFFSYRSFIDKSLNLTDKIIATTYDSNKNATSISFEGPGSEPITWLFKDDLTHKYKVNDNLKLKFEVIQVAQSDNHIYESLNYTIDAENTSNGYPVITEYLN